MHPSSVFRPVSLLRGLAVGGAVTIVVSACSDGSSSADATARSTDPLTSESTLWDATAKPANPSDSDSAPVEVGVRFHADVAGKLNGVRFYKGTTNTGTHTGNLWSTSGALLGSATFANETSSGWQTVRFASPIALAAGTTYVASYHTNVGHYASTESYFTGKGVDHAPLHAPADGAGGANGVYHYGNSGFPDQTYRGSNYWVDVVFAANGTSSTDACPPATDSGTPATDSGTPATDSGITPTPDAGPTACTGAAQTPGGSDGSGGCFPGPNNTGVPAGTTLTAYTGPCTITAANTVIDAKTINCDLAIEAANVRITRSKITGSVATDENSTGYSFSISDSEVDIGNRAGTGVGAVNFTATRVHVTGGNRSMNCWHDCLITDSYVHGQFRDSTGVYHESGMRMGQSATIRHNTIICDAPDVPPDAGCSADLTGYGDFGPVQNNLIEKNFFGATTGGYCTYGGSSQGKPYSSATNHITFNGNVWQRGTRLSDKGTKVCGYYGSNTSFDPSLPGNTWSNNKFDDGTTVASSN